MPTYTVYQQDEFPAHLKWQALGFMRTHWPDIFSGGGRLISETYGPDDEPVHFAATEGEVLFSYAALLRVTVEHASAPYAVYGFGNMFTFPPYRHEGHGLRLVEMATDYIRASAMDLGILFCDHELQGFYARCGWEVAPGYAMILFVSGKGKARREALLTQPLQLERYW